MWIVTKERGGALPLNTFPNKVINVSNQLQFIFPQQNRQNNKLIDFINPFLGNT